MSNIFIQNPPRVAILNLEDMSVRHTLVFLGDVPANIYLAAEGWSKSPSKTTGAPLREYYGSDFAEKLGAARLDTKTQPRKVAKDGGEELDFDMDLDSIERALEQTTTQPAIAVAKLTDVELKAEQFKTSVSYPREIHIFPEDTMASVKEKIQLATRIPTYRQHLFYEAPHYTTTYNIFLNAIYDTDLRNIHGDATTHIFGIPIDKYLYDSRGSVQVNALDTFNLATDALGTTMFVGDIADYFEPRAIQLRTSLRDTYSMDILYWGFVVKFWPQITRDVLGEFIASEGELANKYPVLVKSSQVLSSKYAAEKKVIINKYRNYGDADVLTESGKVQIAITQASVFTPNTYTPVNIRNLFDLLPTSQDVPEIRAYIMIERKSYELRKRHRSATEDIIFPAGIVKTGVIMAIATKLEYADALSSYMFFNVLPSGAYICRIRFPSILEYDFTDTLETIIRLSRPSIAQINKLSGSVFLKGGNIPNISVETAVYKNISMYLYWKRTMSIQSFQAMKGFWDPYITAGIIARRLIQGVDRFEFNFIKGMFEYDRTAISRILAASGKAELKNQYMWQIDPAIHARWMSVYGYRAAKMVHRLGDVRFEISNIHEREFRLFYDYVLSYILTVQASKEQIFTSHKKMSKIHALRDLDPKLYDFSKLGSKHIYSRFCQREHQPRVWSPEEYARRLSGLSGKEKELAVALTTKYWNFTTEAPAYYDCPNKKYPHLNFMLGYHPRNYCVPCCNKLKKKESKTAEHCLSKHVLTREIKADALGLRHVMKAGKFLLPGRISHIPSDTLGRLFATSARASEHYVLGVPQDLPGLRHSGMLFCIGVFADMSVDLLYEGLKKYISTSNIHSLAGGKASDYFVDIPAVLSGLDTIRKPAANNEYAKDAWTIIFQEFAVEVLGIYVVTYSEETKTLKMQDEVSRNYANSMKEVSFGVAVEQGKAVFPMVSLNRAEFHQSGIIVSRVYPGDTSDVGSSISRALEWAVRLRPKKFTSRDIPRGKYTVAGRLMSLSHKIYGVILKAPSNSHVFAAIPFEGLTSFNDAPIIQLDAALESPGNFTGEALLEYFKDTNQTPLEVWDTAGSEWLIAQCDSGLHWFQRTPTVKWDCPTKNISFDPRVVNNRIIAQTPPVKDNLDTRANYATYTNYLYQLFVKAFVNYVSAEKNHAFRKQLNEVILSSKFSRGTKEFKDKIYKMLHRDDYAKIVEKISDMIVAGTFTPKKLVAAISKTNYLFDQTTINEIIALPREEATVRIRKMANEFAVVGRVPEGAEFPNIYVACEYDEKQMFCEGKKLICDRPLEELSDLLVGDLLNPLMRKYIFEVAVSHVDYFKFIVRNSETLTIIQNT